MYFPVCIRLDLRVSRWITSLGTEERKRQGCVSLTFVRALSVSSQSLCLRRGWQEDFFFSFRLSPRGRSSADSYRLLLLVPSFSSILVGLFCKKMLVCFVAAEFFSFSLAPGSRQVKVVINVASNCGLTKGHNKELFELREKFGPENFEVILFFFPSRFALPLSLERLFLGDRNVANRFNLEEEWDEKDRAVQISLSTSGERERGMLGGVVSEPKNRPFASESPVSTAAAGHAEAFLSRGITAATSPSEPRRKRGSRKKDFPVSLLQNLARVYAPDVDKS